MKSFVFTVLIFASCYLVNAQALFNNNAIAKSEILKRASNTHSVGKLIWSEDFNRSKWFSTVSGDSLGYLLNANALLPRGWSFVDSTGNDFFWHWSDVGPRGRWTSEDSVSPNNSLLDLLPEGTSIENGFMLLESDYFNTDSLGEMVSDLIDMNTYFEFGPIDFSTYQKVIFNCRISERTCCNAMYMWAFLQISGDYRPDGYVGHWTEHGLSDYNLESSTSESAGKDFYLDIQNASNLGDSVYFRILKKNATHYYTIIDDIKFYEAPKNELILKNGWVDFMNPFDWSYGYFGGYTKIPQSVIDNFMEYGAVVSNRGSNTAENTRLNVKIFKDMEMLDSLVSETKTIQSGVNDTLIIATDFSPTELGSYQVSTTVSMDSIDEFPENNGWLYEFETTKNTFSRVRYGKEDEFGNASTRDWVNGGYDGDMLLVEYDIDHNMPVEFSGIKVYVYPTTDEDELAAIANGDFKLKAVVFEHSHIDDEFIDVNIYSDLYTLSSDDLGTWLYLPFVDNDSLMQSTGVYFVGVEQYTGTEAELRFRIGSDFYGIDQPKYVNLIYQTHGSGFNYVDENYAIDLMVNIPEEDTTGVFAASQNNISFYPNPFSDYLNISNAESISEIQILNALGQVVKTSQVTSKTTTVATDDLQKGMYIVVVKYNDNTLKSVLMLKE